MEDEYGVAVDLTAKASAPRRRDFARASVGAGAALFSMKHDCPRGLYCLSAAGRKSQSSIKCSGADKEVLLLYVYVYAYTLYILTLGPDRRFHGGTGVRRRRKSGL